MGSPENSITRFDLGKATLYGGDCIEVMKKLIADGVQFDSIVCDPPYHLTSIVKRFGSADAAPAQHGTDGAYARASRGFMGKEWDGGDIAFRIETWSLALQILKPGGHLIAFSGSRTYHRMACAIEDAGFEIRDQIMWLYGSGFPKSHDVSKAIDKKLGAQPVVVETVKNRSKNPKAVYELGFTKNDEYNITAAATATATAWQGWGTALKPAHEPCVLARKPFKGSVAENVMTHGTGAINIDGCRVGDSGGTATITGDRKNETVHAYGDGLDAQGGKIESLDLGRWPANVLHDGSEEVEDAFPEGSARFFYSAKAQEGDRMGSKHPTVKPIDLMAYLIRMVTPPGGTVIDIFAGSGSTGIAAIREGFIPTMIEREPEYQEDIKNRFKFIAGMDTPLFSEG